MTAGLGAGSQPELGRAAAEEVIDTIRDQLTGAHMVFVTAGMGGGTGTGAAPIVARIARELGILTIGVVTKPFYFEGQRRMRFAEAGIEELLKTVDTLLIIPNQNLFRVASEKTTFADAFALADQVLYSGVACISDLIVKEGLINLDFADVLSVMKEKGKAMMGRGEASGEKRVLAAAVAAISNPLIENPSIKRASGLIISITGGKDLMLYEVDEAATRIRDEADPDANIIVGASFDESLEGIVRVSVVATGIDNLDAARRRCRWKPPSPNSPEGCAMTAGASPIASSAVHPFRKWKARRSARSRIIPWDHRQGRAWSMRATRRFSRSIPTAAPLRAMRPTRPFSISRPSCAAPPTERSEPAQLASSAARRQSRCDGCASRAPEDPFSRSDRWRIDPQVRNCAPSSRQEARPGMTDAA